MSRAYTFAVFRSRHTTLYKPPCSSFISSRMSGEFYDPQLAGRRNKSSQVLFQISSQKEYLQSVCLEYLGDRLQLHCSRQRVEKSKENSLNLRYSSCRQMTNGFVLRSFETSGVMAPSKSQECVSVLEPFFFQHFRHPNLSTRH